MSHNFTIEKTVWGVEVELEFDYTPAKRSPTPLELPDDSAEVDLISITVGGQDITNIVNDTFREKCEDFCFSEGADLLADEEDSARADRFEYYAEMERG